jgi:hypothetical protein
MLKVELKTTLSLASHSDILGMVVGDQALR